MHTSIIASIAARAVCLRIISIDTEVLLASQAAGWPQVVYTRRIKDCVIEACGEKYKMWALPTLVMLEHPQCNVLGFVRNDEQQAPSMIMELNVVPGDPLYTSPEERKLMDQWVGFVNNPTKGKQ